MNMQVTDLIDRNNISLIEIHKQLVKEINPNKEIEKIIEDGNDIIIKEKFSIKKKLTDYLKDTNNEIDNEKIAFEKLSNATREFQRETFKDIPLN